MTPVEKKLTLQEWADLWNRAKRANQVTVAELVSNLTRYREAARKHGPSISNVLGQRQ